MALERVYPDKRVHCILIWTDEPKIMPLSDGVLATHRP
jgi:ATP-dependent helicase/nuclease subunit A